MRISKGQLEMLEINGAGGENGGFKDKATLVRAANAGVRFTRTASISTNIKLQGDLRCMSAEAVQKRAELKESPPLKALVKQWWDSIQLKKTVLSYQMASEAAKGNGGAAKTEAVIDKATFVLLSCSLQKMLDPITADGDSDDESESNNSNFIESVRLAETDWESDKRQGTDVMGWPEFYSSMFELCDVWAEGVEFEQ